MVAGHVLPGPPVYGGLRAGVDRGWCDAGLAHDPDVGPFYLALAAVATVPSGRRLLAGIAGVLIPPW